MSEWIDDDLTDEDLEFLSQWENAGHDSKEHEALEIGQDTPEGDAPIDIIGESDNDVEGENDDADDPDKVDSDEVDESQMDISQMGDNEGYEPSDSDDEGDDDELDHNDEDFEREREKEYDHLGNNEEEAPDEIPEGESDLPYDPLAESDEDSDTEQAEEEFGDGERADTDSEVDLDEYEQEREEHEQEINAEGDEEFEGDAQDELNKHLENEQEDPEPESDESDDGDDASDSGDSNPEDQGDGDDGGDEDGNSHDAEDNEKNEPEPLTEQPDENQEESEEQHSGMFDKLPEAGDLCTNHCEDNPPEESLEESCPHCTERIRKERELHGAIATDMHGNDILPGDKLHVRIPFGMIAKDSIVTANVPNMEIDPERLAVTTIGKKSKDKCWLSGNGVSNFTGWRMTGVGNAVWTFNKGAQITFAEKIAQPLFDSDNPDEIMDKFMDDLENIPETENESEKDEQHEQHKDGSSGAGDSEGSEDAPEENESDEEAEAEEESEEPEAEVENLDEHREPQKDTDNKRLIAELVKLQGVAVVFDLDKAANLLGKFISNLKDDAA